MAGLVLVLLDGLVSGALLQPALAQLVWVIAGLALGGGVIAQTEEVPMRALRWATVPTLLVAAAAFGWLVCRPAVRSAHATYHAHVAGEKFNQEGFYHDAVEVPSRSFLEQETRLANAELMLAKTILPQLEKAVQADPGDATRRLELAAWRRVEWRLMPGPMPARKIDTDLALFESARALDPDSAAPPLAEFLTRLTFAIIHPSMFRNPQERQLAHLRRLRAEQLQKAEELIPVILKRDPALEARLHFRLAQALIRMKDDPAQPSELHERGRRLAAEARELDAAAPGPRWRLTEAQREQLRGWLKSPE